MGKKFYTTGQLGKILGVSRITVYKWIKSKKIEGVRLPGGRWIILKDVAEKIIKERNMDISQIFKEVKILIGDDDVDLSNGLKSYLENKNPSFKIVSAYNGFEVGKYLYSFQPDVLIVDIFMPGIDGFEICRCVRKEMKLKDTLIIAITGYPEKENIKKIKREGANYVITKPFDFQIIEKIIKKYYNL